MSVVKPSVKPTMHVCSISKVFQVIRSQIKLIIANFGNCELFFGSIGSPTNVVITSHR